MQSESMKGARRDLTRLEDLTHRIQQANAYLRTFRGKESEPRTRILHLADLWRQDYRAGAGGHREQASGSRKGQAGKDQEGGSVRWESATPGAGLRMHTTV